MAHNSENSSLASDPGSCRSQSDDKAAAVMIPWRKGWPAFETIAREKKEIEERARSKDEVRAEKRIKIPVLFVGDGEANQEDDFFDLFGRKIFGGGGGGGANAAVTEADLVNSRVYGEFR